jgi:hypothetical protein
MEQVLSSQGDEVQLWSVNQWPTEMEESPLLRFITRKHLVKTLQRNSHCGAITKQQLVKADLENFTWSDL